MGNNCHHIKLEELPDTVAVFPLADVLLLPGGELPLNIFEERYLAMVNYALSTPQRLIGMIQPHDGDAGFNGMFRTGCAGRISSFSETDDGRYLITLTGVCRFEVKDELPQMNGFRRVNADFAKHTHDLESCGGLDLDRARLVVLLKEYFRVEGLSCNWDKIRDAADDKLITALSMVCPLEGCDKQALLEATDSKARAKMFIDLLEHAVMTNRQSGDDNCSCH